MKTALLIAVLLVLQNAVISANADGIIAVVEKEAVSQSELDVYIKTSVLFMGGSQLPNKRLQDEFERERYQSLLNISLVLNSGDTSGVLDISAEAVDEEFSGLLANLAENITGDSTQIDSLDVFFTEAGIDWALAKDIMRREFFFKIATERYITFNYPRLAYVDEYFVSDEVLEKFYEDVKDSLVMPVSYRFSRIILSPIPSERQLMQVNSKANAVLQALNSGEDFRSLASIYSDDPDARINGGNIGIVRRGETEPELERLIFSIETGTMGVAQSVAGIHIIYVPAKWADSARVYEIFLSLLPTREDTLQTLADVEAVMNLLDGGADFHDVARQYSQDPYSKDEGGYLGEVPAESLDISVRAILDMLEPGEYTEPIPSPFGFIVISLEGLTMGEPESFESVKEQLSEVYLLKERQKALENWLNEIKETVYLEERTKQPENEN
ncbi:peptidylprolyl isomerase [candidate division WOR-3 bacterium]|nr:peptidylprolyl isomerase [candidate division WOR-3 bacterium]